jgi:5-formyltetrahydrofolate cyclo-ligase
VTGVGDSPSSINSAAPGGGSGTLPAAPGGTKREIRAAVLAARGAAPPGVRASADARLCRALDALVRRLAPDRARPVACYRPVPGEPGGDDLLPTLTGAGLRVLLPVLRRDRDLDWAPYTGPDDLAPDWYGLPTPTAAPLGTAAIASAALVVVPALAVDARGIRLGRGAGCYDRALARVGPHTPVVALLYDGELFARLPAEPHDRPVSTAITPSDGVRRLPLT